MNRLGNVQKYVIGTVLGLISLLVIYGASASNRVASWVDGPASGRAASGQDSIVSLNSDGNATVSQNDSSVVADPNNLTPMQKAGQFPQRQTVVEQSAQADEIRVQPLEASDTQAQQTTTETATTTTPTTTSQADPAPTVTQPAQTTNPEPVRALW